MKNNRKKINNRKAAIVIFLIIGFGALEFPGILFVMDKVYPFIFGLPFLYGYVLCGWIYMCLVLFYAYRTRWGKVPFFKKKKEKSTDIRNG